MALMEAIAVKTPVICSDIRGNRELVLKKEMRFDPKDPKDIVMCICRVLEEDLSEITEVCYKQLGGYQSESVERKMRKEYRIMTAAQHMSEDAGG